MRGWATAAAVAAAALLLSGCLPVTLGEPAGELAPLAKGQKWEGLWMGGKALYLVFVQDPDNGILQLCRLKRATGTERAPAELICTAAHLRKAGDLYLLNLETDSRFFNDKAEANAPSAPRWYFTLVKHEGARVLVWLFDGEAAAKLVEAGKLKGRVVQREGGKELQFDRLEPELLNRWVTTQELAGPLWKHPLVLDYHPLPQ